jgi:hypothetical protein
MSCLAEQLVENRSKGRRGDTSCTTPSPGKLEGGRGEEEHLLMGLGKTFQPPIRQGRKRIKKRK